MTTNYALTDNLPKDAGGQKMMAWIDDTTSQLDFGLPRGIGSETLGATSKVMLHQAVGTHTVGSAIGNNVGVILMGAYTEAPSAIGSGGAQHLRSDKEGALYTRPASAILAFDTTSADIHIAGSALLHDLHIVFNDVNAGDTVTIRDGTLTRFQFIATAASQHFSEHFSGGLVFNTNISHARSIGAAGAASITVGYSQY
jgi:hypothetical protein